MKHDPSNSERYDASKDEVVQDLMEVSRQLTIKRIASMKESTHPCRHSEIDRQEWEKHEDRVSGIKRYFFEKATGHPF